MKPLQNKPMCSYRIKIASATADKSATMISKTTGPSGEIRSSVIKRSIGQTQWERSCKKFALSQLLTIVKNFPDRIAEGILSAEAVHRMVKAERRVYADRAEHLGDNDFYPDPIKALLNVDDLLKCMSNFDADKASISENISAGEPAGIESEETTHFSVVDAEGVPCSSRLRSTDLTARRWSMAAEAFF